MNFVIMDNVIVFIEKYGINYIFIFCYIFIGLVVGFRNKLDKYFDSSIILFCVGVTLALLSAVVLRYRIEEVQVPYILSFIVSIIIGAYGLSEIKVKKSKIDDK